MLQAARTPTPCHNWNQLWHEENTAGNTAAKLGNWTFHFCSTVLASFDICCRWAFSGSLSRIHSANVHEDFSKLFLAFGIARSHSRTFPWPLCPCWQASESKDGIRVAQPQKLPEKLLGKTLFPHVSFKNTTLHVNFGPPAVFLGWNAKILAVFLVPGSLEVFFVPLVEAFALQVPLCGRSARSRWCWGTCAAEGQSAR